MTNILKSMNHHRQNLFISTPYISSSSDNKSLLFHQVESLAETTIQRYKVPPQHIVGSIPMVTIIQPTTKVEHPFDAY